MSRAKYERMKIRRGKGFWPDYSKYLLSEEWKEKRWLVLERDGHVCAVCTSNEELQIQHRTYDHVGDEPLEDLITICKKHHEAITNVDRKHRYAKKKLEVSDIIIEKRGRGGEKQNEEFKVEDYRNSSSPYAQRANSRSTKLLEQANQIN